VAGPDILRGGVCPLDKRRGPLPLNLHLKEDTLRTIRAIQLDEWEKRKTTTEVGEKRKGRQLITLETDLR